MATEIKPTYLSRDGRSFPSAEQATERNSLLDAVSAFQDAGRNLQRTMSNTARTADGKPIPWSCLEYFTVAKSRYHFPYARRIWLAPYSCEIETDRNEVTITYRWYDSERRETVHVRASDLYVSEKAAIKACLAFAEESLGEFAAEAESMKARLEKMK